MMTVRATAATATTKGEVEKRKTRWYIRFVLGHWLCRGDLG